MEAHVVAADGSEIDYDPEPIEPLGLPIKEIDALLRKSDPGREVEFSVLNVRQNMWAWNMSSEHKAWLAERHPRQGGLFDCACQEDVQPTGHSSDEDQWVTPPTSSTPDPPPPEDEMRMMSSRVSSLFSGFFDPEAPPEPHPQP